MKYPDLFRIRQLFDSTKIDDIQGAVVDEIRSCPFNDKFKPGDTVAVAAGSRGINKIDIVLTTVAGELKKLGLKPFIMPAMGSHGGAEAAGQISVLDGLGVTQSTMGADIVSHMETEIIGKLDSGAEVHLAVDAIKADHLVVVNRVKAHTAFRGDVESGLCKILTVGCGKHQGAINMHKYGLGDSIVPAAEMILQNKSVLFGLALVENAMEQLHTIKAVLPEEFIKTDKTLLKAANQHFPKIPTNDLDILIIDEMGKNISGAGMDPNVVGFWRRIGGPRIPDYRTIIILDITAQSHGNAMGIGSADLTTQRVWDMIDFKAVYTNALTAGAYAAVKMPMPLDNDRAAIEDALKRVPDGNSVRLARIRSTLHLEEFLATRPVVEELRNRPDMEIDDAPVPLSFDENGRII